jgi:hypothetical protein
MKNQTLHSPDKLCLHISYIILWHAEHQNLMINISCFGGPGLDSSPRRSLLWVEVYCGLYQSIHMSDRKLCTLFSSSAFITAQNVRVLYYMGLVVIILC